MIKYPRTQHLESSRLQPGDEDLESVSFDSVKDRFLIIEEKCDGSNCGISFEDDKMMLQSRGHYLVGNDHPQFNLLKSWAFCMQSQLYDILGNRYIMYGEWLYAKHTVFYDQLPHYFLEFDILDRETGLFLSTEDREIMLSGSSIHSVPVLARQRFDSLSDVVALVSPSKFKSQQMRRNLRCAAEAAGLHPETVLKESDSSELMEGLYIKDETTGVVDGRYKWVRHDFVQMILKSGSHWMQRSIVVNRLADGVNIFAN